MIKKFIQFTLTIILLIISLFPNDLYSQAGTLDLSFDRDGIATTSIGNSNDFGKAVVLQRDNKILVAGNSGNNIAIVRYNGDGSLDNTFGNNGIVSTNIGCANGIGNALALQSDDKIIVGGYCGIFPNYDFALVRYTPNGQLDKTFDTDGIVTTAIGNGGDVGRSIAIQPDGKILLGGNTDNGTNADFAIVRYHINGSLDTSFNLDGRVTTAIGNAGEIIRNIALQADGKILAAGFSYVTPSYSYDFALLRYLANGSLDHSFGTGGIVTTKIINNTNDYGESIAIQADGKIIIAGYSFNGYLLITRYLPNGNLDNSFGTGGAITTAFGAAYSNDYSMVLQRDGAILVGGYSNLNRNHSDFAMVRYKKDGSLDNSFGLGGMINTPIGNTDDIATTMAIQTDGKIVLAGRTHNGTNFDFAVVRYNNDMITGLTDSNLSNANCKFLPNPFSIQTILQSDVAIKEFDLTLFNSFGQQVKKIKSSLNNPLILMRENLSAGLYFVRLHQESKLLMSEILYITD